MVVAKKTTQRGHTPAACGAAATRGRLCSSAKIIATAFLLIAGGMWAVGQEHQSLDIVFSPHGVIRWERDQHPVLIVEPLRGDGWISLAKRYAGDPSRVGALRRANPGLKSPMRGRSLRVPVEVLYPDLRLEVVRRLFPVDSRTVAGWQHVVLDPFRGGEESWQWLTELFTGSAGEAASVQQANPSYGGNPPSRGRPVTIPEGQLLGVFRALPPVPTPTPRSTSIPTRAVPPPVPSRLPRQSPVLEYGADELGEFAVYRLRRGEALYSAVVVRFTGQLLAKQVNETAMEIALRSGIDDVTDIPVGYPVKIPLDALLREYLPADNPRRVAWAEEQRELGSFLEVVDAANLSGVQVILDAGHGGKDSGAVSNGLWEATYAYDLMCRIKANLERHTRATVWTTIEYGRVGYSVPATDRLAQNRDAFLLTRPKYRLEDSVLGVHLRWYLTNDIILNRLASDFPRSRTVFLSLHADSLHPSVRGAMAYVPSRYLRPDKPYTVRRRDIQKFAEYRNHPTVRLSSTFKARVEASSRHLAESILGSLENNEIGVHPYEPVRDRVRRGRQRYVPAVLRYTAAQNAVLLECCNMANADDRAQLMDQAWRERFARSVVEGMASAFAN